MSAHKQITLDKKDLALRVLFEGDVASENLFEILRKQQLSLPDTLESKFGMIIGGTRERRMSVQPGLPAHNCSRYPREPSIRFMLDELRSAVVSADKVLKAMYDAGHRPT